MDDTGVVLIVFWVVVVNPLVGYAIGERRGTWRLALSSGSYSAQSVGLLQRCVLAIFGNAHFARKISSRMQKVCRYCGRDLPPLVTAK